MTTSRTDAVYLDAYEGVRSRLAALVTDADADALVPACPGWRVRDMLAHLAGLCQDWVNYHLDGYASEPWTAAQVARFTGLSCNVILDKWGQDLATFRDLGAEPVMGRPPARWAFGDAVIHEGDIRGALAAGRVPTQAVLLALEGSIERWREVLARQAAPALHLRSPDAASGWRLGASHSSESVVCQAPAYEIFRALAGRRTVEQVGTWQWSADPDPFILAGLPEPFRWARAPLFD